MRRRALRRKDGERPMWVHAEVMEPGAGPRPPVPRPARVVDVEAGTKGPNGERVRLTKPAAGGEGAKAGGEETGVAGGAAEARWRVKLLPKPMVAVEEGEKVGDEVQSDQVPKVGVEEE